MEQRYVDKYQDEKIENEIIQWKVVVWIGDQHGIIEMVHYNGHEYYRFSKFEFIPFTTVAKVTKMAIAKFSEFCSCQWTKDGKPIPSA